MDEFDFCISIEITNNDWNRWFSESLISTLNLKAKISIQYVAIHSLGYIFHKHWEYHEEFNDIFEFQLVIHKCISII